MVAVFSVVLASLLLHLVVASSAAAPPACSVTDWGAKPGDDSADDAPAFRKALAACRGATVTVPAGDYQGETDRGFRGLT
jgi:polygalacturonase